MSSNPCVYMASEMITIETTRLGLRMAAWLQAKLRVCGLGLLPRLNAEAKSATGVAYSAFGAV